MGALSQTLTHRAVCAASRSQTRAEHSARQRPGFTAGSGAAGAAGAGAAVCVCACVCVCVRACVCACACVSCLRLSVPMGVRFYLISVVILVQ